ncbi:MAG TPA: NAD-dependent epimerase/dehydratase family protein [Alphaproteobacteria bacterium]|nr:NAD-dependent epimerase/dehydratase family protein [Alphaproteobacteria bacterium]
MRVLITGAGGFIGRKLTEALLAEGNLAGSNGKASAVSKLVLVDRVAVAPPRSVSVGIEVVAGDLAEAGFAERLAGQHFDSVFYLAATLTHEAERDPVGAYATNVEPLRRFIDTVSGPAPRLVFTSSIAVFGGALPATVGDDPKPRPQTTYGAHKAIAELLLADHSRHGRIDGRALRLPIILVRGGASTPAVSDQIAAIVREPLAGRNVVSGLAPQTRLPVASARAAAAALIALHNQPPAVMPNDRAMNLPALTVTVSEMVKAVERHGGKEAAARIAFAPNARLQAIVDGWPKQFVSETATRLGLRSDANFDAIVADHLADRRHGQNA